MNLDEAHAVVVVAGEAKGVVKMDEENLPPSDEDYSEMIMKIEIAEVVGVMKSWKRLVTDTLMSRYFYASLVYLAYAVAMVHT